jgi:hypothetical protein
MKRPRLSDPQKLALTLLSRQARRFSNPLVTDVDLEQALGSRGNVYQVIHRLRSAGVVIRRERYNARADLPAGYALEMYSDDAWRRLWYHRHQPAPGPGHPDETAADLDPSVSAAAAAGSLPFHVLDLDPE